VRQSLSENQGGHQNSVHLPNGFLWLFIMPRGERTQTIFSSKWTIKYPANPLLL
jgi:hypothetical protein